MFSSIFFFLFLQTSYKKVSFIINLNPIEELFESVEAELDMKYATLKDGTNGIILQPLEGDFGIGTDWNTTLSKEFFNSQFFSFQRQVTVKSY